MAETFLFQSCVKYEKSVLFLHNIQPLRDFPNCASIVSVQTFALKWFWIVAKSISWRKRNSVWGEKTIQNIKGRGRISEFCLCALQTDISYRVSHLSSIPNRGFTEQYALILFVYFVYPMIRRNLGIRLRNWISPEYCHSFSYKYFIKF